MSKLAILLSISVCAFACLAQPVAKFPRWTVERLNKFITPAPKDDIARDLAKRKAAANIGFTYVDGIIDATEGRDWCYVSKVPSAELNGEITTMLGNIPADARDKNAAISILKFLREKYPCSQSK